MDTEKKIQLMESDAQSTQLGASKLIIAHLEKQA
jgi:hypothetical protein